LVLGQPILDRPAQEEAEIIPTAKTASQMKIINLFFIFSYILQQQTYKPAGLICFVKPFLFTNASRLTMVCSHTKK
jgi:hypothetical protein